MTIETNEHTHNNIGEGTYEMSQARQQPSQGIHNKDRWGEMRNKYG